MSNVVIAARSGSYVTQQTAHLILAPATFVMTVVFLDWRGLLARAVKVRSIVVKLMLLVKVGDVGLWS